MSRIFLIHGAYGHPGENWFPWLKKELRNLGHEVITPHFPTPENQSLDTWLDVMKKHEQFIAPDNIYIGHSLGVALVLNWLENNQAQVAYLVSGFWGALGDPKFDIPNKSFFEKDLNWQKIKANCQNFKIYHADDDPYIPLDNAQVIADKLGEEIEVLSGRGHFNAKAGVLEFPELLGELKKW